MAVQVSEPSDTDPAPVSHATLTGRSRGLAKNVARETMGIAVSFLYDLPQMLAPSGTANHWPLSDVEEKTLVDRIDAVSEMIPKRSRSKGLEVLAKITAPIALVVTAFLITKPRIDLTRQLMAQRKRSHTPNNANAHPPVESQRPTAANSGPALVRDERSTVNDASSNHAIRTDDVGTIGSSGDATQANSALSDVASRF